jgi:hypothetical protein
VFTPSTSATSASTLTVSGLAEAGSRVEVNGLLATRNGDAFSAVVGLLPGLNALRVNATDDAGNVAQWVGAAWSDADAPQLTASAAANATTAGGLPLTRAARVVISGTVSDGTTEVASLAVNGEDAQWDQTGQFAFSAALVEGENTLVVTATDTVGHSTSVTLRVARDSTVPTASSNLVAGDGSLVESGGYLYTNGTNVKVVVVLTEDADVEISGVPHDGAEGLNTFVVPLAEGTNTLAVSVRDAAGNGAPTVTLTVARDGSPPTVAIGFPAAGATVLDSYVVVTGTSEPGSTVTVNGAAVPVGSAGAFSVRVELRPGGNTIRAVAKDAAGNTASTEISVSTPVGGGAIVEGGGGSAFLFLLVGLAAGAGASALLLRKRAPGAEAGERDPFGEAPAAPPPEGPRQSGPAPPRSPRGPRPPGP